LPKVIRAVKASKSCKNRRADCDEVSEGCSMTGHQNNKYNNIENMKTLTKLVLAAAMFGTAVALQAQVDVYGTTTVIGDTAFSDFNVSGGYGCGFCDISGTSTTIGDFTFHNYYTSDGGYVSGTTTVIGDTAFSDFNASGGYGSDSLDISGTSTAIGDFTFHNYSTSDGDIISGDSITIGDTTFTDLSEW
jgi:hypothetical protein